MVDDVPVACAGGFSGGWARLLMLEGGLGCFAPFDFAVPIARDGRVYGEAAGEIIFAIRLGVRGGSGVQMVGHLRLSGGPWCGAVVRGNDV